MAHRKLTQDEFLAECKERFGDNPLAWAFVCPNCGDVATGQDFADALKDHPRTGRDGETVLYWHILGQECIGRVLGALSGPPTDDQGRGRAERGCDWAAYGLIHGPWEVVVEGQSVWSFPLADAPTPASEAAATPAPAEVQA